MLTDTRPTRLTLAYVAAIAALAVLLRVAPYYLNLGWGVWNLMPVGALALFAGSRLRNPTAWVVPLIVMFHSDLLLVYPLSQMDPPLSAFSLVRTPVIYASFAVYVALGRFIGRAELSPPTVAGVAVLAGAQFYLLTNVVSWYVDVNSPTAIYTPDLAGLTTAIVAGIPFHKYTLAADLLYSAVIFGGYALLTWSVGYVKSFAVVTR